MNRRRCLLILAFLSTCLPNYLAADEAFSVHTVKIGPFEVSVELDGVIVAEQMQPIALRPEAWSAFVVQSAVPHGQRVKKGQTLVQFDTSAISQAISDAETDQRLAQLALREAEAELPELERSLQLKLEVAQRTAQTAHEELSYFEKTDRAQAEKRARFSLKSAEHSLEYVTEELEQLEKMYKADDLTEESEEIILKRQRNNVEQAKFSLERVRLGVQRTLNVELARQHQELRQAVAEADVALALAKNARSLTLDQKRLALAKLKVAHTRAMEKHLELRKDRDLHTLRAPVAGVVYYGDCVDGRWSGIAAVQAKLRVGGKAAPGDLLMTIVAEGSPVAAHMAIAEADLSKVRAGDAAQVVPTAFPDQTLVGKVGAVSGVPNADGKFAASIDLKAGKNSERLVAGMTCKARVTSYRNDAALTVPVEAVHDDEGDPEKHFVLVETADKKHERRAVKIGRRNEKSVKVLDGLAKGDRVLIEK
jgi:multidrug efflux pump subunit AcrA (membrane-fusion protein)